MRILSGIQPSGRPHLGNYFGALRQYISLQAGNQPFYFIASYHALTTVQDPALLREYTTGVALDFLALGLDPAISALFAQQDVPEVTELAWILSCVTPMGMLERATSYKDKIDRGIKASVGLFTYPVLMAADILSYDATLVPVGKDQIQHVEMTQDMATHFNETYGKGEELLRRPEFRLSEAPYVTGSDGKKMSSSYGNTIPLFESGKKLKKIVGAIVTDSTELGQPLNPESCNVFSLLKLFAGPSDLDRIAGYYRAGKRDGEPFGYGHAKMLLADHIERQFAPARARRDELLAKPELIEDALRRSAEIARKSARATLDRCRRATGLA